MKYIMIMCMCIVCTFSSCIGFDNNYREYKVKNLNTGKVGVRELCGPIKIGETVHLTQFNTPYLVLSTAD